MISTQNQPKATCKPNHKIRKNSSIIVKVLPSSFIITEMVLRNVKSKCLYKFSVMLQALSQVETVIPKLTMHVQVFFLQQKNQTHLHEYLEVSCGLGWILRVFFRLVGVLFCCSGFVLNYSKLLLPFFSQMPQLTSKKLSESKIQEHQLKGSTAVTERLGQCNGCSKHDQVSMIFSEINKTNSLAYKKMEQRNNIFLPLKNNH